MDYSEFKCKWIDPVSIWNIADQTRNKYWPESKLQITITQLLRFVEFICQGQMQIDFFLNSSTNHFNETYLI